MTATTSTHEFLELVRKHGLVAEGDLARCWSGSDGPEQEMAVEGLAQALVDEGLLTAFQARQLLKGRRNGFLLANTYLLLDQLAAGGMGWVYLAEHLTLKRLVALKMLPPYKRHDRLAHECFAREAWALAQLNHPNLVRFHERGQAGGLPFLVLDYVDGCDMHHFVAQNGRMLPARAAGFIHQAALGVQHLHDLDLVHCDLKPGNLVLDRRGTIKVIDLGLVCRTGMETEDLGTADFLAPEQAAGRRVDARTDVYSLGASLYYLLTGQQPFHGDAVDKMLGHQWRQPVPVAAVRGDVPAGLLAVLEGMMAKEPAHRYDCAGAAADALAPWVISVLPAPAELPAACPGVLRRLHAAGAAAASSVRLHWQIEATQASVLDTVRLRRTHLETDRHTDSSPTSPVD